MSLAKDGIHKILITGATSAIGQALAERYASEGVTLYLTGRNETKLLEIVQTCRDKGAEVSITVLDLRDFIALRSWLKTIDNLDLVIANAGMNISIGSEGEPESPDEVDALLDVNLKSVMVMIQAVLPSMQVRGSGQIAIMSSLAAHFGLPVTPSYCASKAGLKAYGESLRGLVSSQGIKVNVIMPGYVRSKMCDEMPGPKPFLMEPAKAAYYIQRGLAKDKPRISFPFPLNFGTWCLSVLPASLSTWIVRHLGYGK